MWKDRKVETPEGSTPQELIKVPRNAQYFAVLGAIEFGKNKDDDVGRFVPKRKPGPEVAVSSHRTTTSAPLRPPTDERNSFQPFQSGTTGGGFVGVDGASISTTAVLLSEEGQILCKACQLSKGNPIQDTIDMFEKLREQVESQGAKLEVLGVATTG